MSSLGRRRSVGGKLAELLLSMKGTLRVWGCVGVACWFVGTTSHCSVAQERITKVPLGFELLQSGLALPKEAVIGIDGQLVDLDFFRGRTLVLNLWATWCGPCVKEIPSLERLSAKLPTERFEVVLLSQDRGGPAVAAPFLERLGARTRGALFDPRGKLFRELGLRGLPSTIVIGPKGNLLARVEGEINWDRADVLEFLLTLSQ